MPTETETTGPRIPSIYDHFLNPHLDEEPVVLHIRLLEHFTDLRQRVTSWAQSHGISFQAVWDHAVNLATKRMFHWFTKSFVMDLDDVLPPIDVLLMWYTFMCGPERWQAYTRRSRLVLDCWPWTKLVSSHPLWSHT